MQTTQLAIAAGIWVCLAVAGCGEGSLQHSDRVALSQALVPEMTLQSGETLQGFDLLYVSHDYDWERPTDPIRTRISDSETREIARAILRGIRMTDIERDERGFVERMQVVYTTDRAEILGWSYPLGVFAFHAYIAPQQALSEADLNRLFVEETGFHVNDEVRMVNGRQVIRIPLVQLQSLTLPHGAMGDGFGLSPDR